MDVRQRRGRKQDSNSRGNSLRGEAPKEKEEEEVKRLSPSSDPLNRFVTINI